MTIQTHMMLTYLLIISKKLKAGQAINKPIYDFVNHKRSDEIGSYFSS